MNDAQLTCRLPSVEELVGACLRGEEAAFRALVDRLLPDAMALAIQFVRHRDSAEDVVQEAFLRLARSLPTFDRRRPFAPWFFTIVRNCARDHAARLRRRGREVAHEVDGAMDRDGEAHASSDGAGLSVDLRRALAHLPEMQQRSLRLCLVEGYTSGEAAALLGVREGTVRTHLKRARTRLRALLGDAGELP